MKRLLIVLACIFCLAAAAGWYAITQPLFGDAPRVNAPAMPDLQAMLRRHVQKLSVDFVPRDHLNVDNLNATADYIRTELAETGARTSTQPFQINGLGYQNVIASFGPETGETIVIGAHYDAYGKFPAADDNASGVAGLLALAKMLKGASPKHRIELIAYTLEEPPYFRSQHMGSHVHASHLARRKAPVKLMLSLECIGYFSDAPNTQDFPVPGLALIYPTIGNFIAVVGRYADRKHVRVVKRAMRGASTLPAHSISAPAFVQGIDFSDQLNYWAEGYPALMVTDTAFFRNKAYHTKDDTLDRLDFARMADVVRGVYAAVMAVDAE